MGSSSGLVARMDFSVGEEFEREVHRRFGVQVHHESPSPRGSFFLLATFRRFLFRLTEDSVSLALQSCLGGLASKFHVVELSHNHFRFSVSCKAVGFHVYALRRFIGETFDVYFYLFNNGVPHWEREKRLWEEEEAKKWTLVLSKCQKRNAKSQSANASAKKVRFAPKLVLASPVKKFAPPTPGVQLISFGEFKTSVVSMILPLSPSLFFPLRMVGLCTTLLSSTQFSWSSFQRTGQFRRLPGRRPYIARSLSLP